MSRNKLKRFAELATFPNVFYDPFAMKGRWHELFFRNNHALTLELACGKGEYTVTLAQRFPGQNFIGVDAKGARLWKGAKIAQLEKLSNAAFVKGQIEQLPHFFAEQEVQEIWITFPEPYPEHAKARKRLTAPQFLNEYRRILPPSGVIHLKTDDLDLFKFTLKSVQAEGGLVHEALIDLYQSPGSDDRFMIQTTYERRYLSEGKTIKYVCFSL